MQDKIFNVVSPILEEHSQIKGLSEALKYELISVLSERLVSDFFAKSYDFKKKQQKIDEIEEAKRAVKMKEKRIEEMRNISIDRFRDGVLIELNSLVNERNPHKLFELDKFSKHTFDLCFSYFLPNAQTKMDRNKGICLLGKVGTGKSTLLTAFRNNPLSSFRIIKAQEIVDSYINNPEHTLRKVLSEKPITDQENSFGFTMYDLLIEELGREQLNVNVKGESFKNTTINVMERVLMELYDRPGIRVHIISNAETPEKLITLYGEAAASRLYEMFNVITLDPNAPNRRFS